MSAKPCLRIVAYHYVRDFSTTRFPAIKGICVNKFRKQVDALAATHEMATLESLDAFLAGKYVPQLDLCLLTFDDGLKEHFTEVTPILAERKIQGQFFLPTVCLEENRVVLVHKNHFLTASLGFDTYRAEFLILLGELAPNLKISVDAVQAAKSYRFDDPPAAEFKYLLNFCLPTDIRGQVLDSLFAKHLGDEATFAKELYLSWDDARSMQRDGMIMGGHSHRHVALASLSEAEQGADLETCTRLLRTKLQPQAQWPFCYPYGNPADSFNVATVRILQQLDYQCGFTTSAGTNQPGADRFSLQRIDTNEVQLG